MSRHFKMLTLLEPNLGVDLFLWGCPTKTSLSRMKLGSFVLWRLSASVCLFSLAFLFVLSISLLSALISTTVDGIFREGNLVQMMRPIKAVAGASWVVRWGVARWLKGNWCNSVCQSFFFNIGCLNTFLKWFHEIFRHPVFLRPKSSYPSMTDFIALHVWFELMAAECWFVAYFEQHPRHPRR